MSRSFTAGIGEWIGQSEVYDPSGRFLGNGVDSRSVEVDESTGKVTIDVSFDGPFTLSGRYSIADHGTHRIYEGPLNFGWADTLGDNVIAAHNHWPDLGLSQRFFLMTLPSGTRQLSFALISRGEQLKYMVVGESLRHAAEHASPPSFEAMDPDKIGTDLTAGRGEMLLWRSGTWAGDLALFDDNLEPVGFSRCVERTFGAGVSQTVEVSGLHWTSDVRYDVTRDANTSFAPTGNFVGSSTAAGGRAASGTFLHCGDNRRLWKREVCASSGVEKAVLHLWYEGDRRVGAATGVLTYSNHSDAERSNAGHAHGA